MKKNIKTLLVSLFIFTLSFFSLYGVSQDYQITYAVDENGNIIKPVNTSESDLEKIKLGVNTSFPNQKIATDFFNIKKKNPDTIGYISIPSMAYYPIMFNNNNQYYLNHNEYKQFFLPGVPFMNKFSKGNFENISLIHAHRMLDGTMFGSLGKYEESYFFKNNPPIEVFDGKKLMYFKPYTIFLYKDGKQFVNQDKQTYGEKRTKYFQSLAKISRVKPENGLEINYNTDMLFLQTCDYDFNNARLILGAYKIAEVEYNPNAKEKQIDINSNELIDVFLGK